MPLVAQNLNNISRIGRITSLALMPKSTPVIFCDNRMYSQGARAASVLSTHSCFSTSQKQYRVFNGLDGLKVPLLVYTNHINNKKHVHHGFLAPRPYLCSTSLKGYSIRNLKSLIVKNMASKKKKPFSQFLSNCALRAFDWTLA